MGSGHEGTISCGVRSREPSPVGPGHEGTILCGARSSRNRHVGPGHQGTVWCLLPGDHEQVSADPNPISQGTASLQSALPATEKSHL